jgi:hypothetical protein
MSPVPLAYASNDMWATYISPLRRDKTRSSPGAPLSDELTTPQERKLITEQLARLDQTNAGNVEGDE